MSDTARIIIVIGVGSALLYLLLALVGTAAGWWDWLGLIRGPRDD